MKSWESTLFAFLFQGNDEEEKVPAHTFFVLISKENLFQQEYTNVPTNGKAKGTLSKDIHRLRLQYLILSYSNSSYVFHMSSS